MGATGKPVGGRPTYFIAGGGTGGHVYPALAIAKALRASDPTAEILFVGTSAGLEVKAVPAAGFQLFLLPVGKLNLQGRWLEKIKTLVRMPLAFLMSARLLLRHPPEAVLGVGGYASGPFVLVASFLGFSTAIWEPNAYPGLTNRWLSRWVKKCFIVFDESSTRLKTRAVSRLGMPVRQEVEEAALEAHAPTTNLSRPFRIFCTGGSQGARAVNNALFEVLKNWNKSDGELEVVHQIGSTDWPKFKQQYAGMPWVEAQEFINNMPERFKWADLVIARAGASTVAEVSAFGKVALFIPLPGAEAHQEKNAEALADANAALILRQKDLTPERLKNEIVKLMRNEELRNLMSTRIKKFFEPRATARIAEALIDLKNS